MDRLYADIGARVRSIRKTLKKRLLLDIVSDMADRFKTRRGRRTMK